MTYEKLYDLKFRRKMSTYDLVSKYPKEIKRVSELALMDVPEETLRQVLSKGKTLARIMQLKRRFL